MDLLGQIEHAFNVVMGDGAYDSVKLTNAILNKQPGACIKPDDITWNAYIS